MVCGRVLEGSDMRTHRTPLVPHPARQQHRQSPTTTPALLTIVGAANDNRSHLISLAHLQDASSTQHNLSNELSDRRHGNQGI